MILQEFSKCLIVFRIFGTWRENNLLFTSIGSLFFYVACKYWKWRYCLKKIVLCFPALFVYLKDYHNLQGRFYSMVVKLPREQFIFGSIKYKMKYLHGLCHAAQLAVSPILHLGNKRTHFYLFTPGQWGEVKIKLIEPRRDISP